MASGCGGGCSGRYITSRMRSRSAVISAVGVAPAAGCLGGAPLVGYTSSTPLFRASARRGNRR
ncbi:hypothetical protein LNQ52_00075 [Klebsiella pneumoniae subsp. pneumoniae]|nr:hypothetical protein [Klebsiella pneumoniae subsp. pneumoniae]